MKYWALVVAAGVGRRMGGKIPKQYLPLADKTVIEHSLDCLATHTAMAGLVVVTQADDAQWPALAYHCEIPLRVVAGGAERSDSVLAGLQALGDLAQNDDWVLVHDAARACLTHALIDQLMTQVNDDAVGGLLALPTRDTLKNAVDGRVSETLDRAHIWQAQTPQMFRLGLLRQALENARNQDLAITDEAMAMELAGHRPLLVEGPASNIKITRPEDLALAEFILRQQVGR